MVDVIKDQRSKHSQELDDLTHKVDDLTQDNKWQHETMQSLTRSLQEKETFTQEVLTELEALDEVVGTLNTHLKKISGEWNVNE